MFQKETVDRATYSLLKELMLDDRLQDFVLVGGTALALQIGHRTSIDIDLFCKPTFDSSLLSNYLKGRYQFEPLMRVQNTLKGKINGVSIDLLTHAYPEVLKPIEIDGVRMASPEDIAAMKLNAIIGNGSRLKDFIDVAYLSTNLSLEKMLIAYSQKYGTDNPAMAVKALLFHADINFQEAINMTGAVLFSWKHIEKRIKGMVDNPKEIFKTPPTGNNH